MECDVCGVEFLMECYNAIMLQNAAKWKHGNQVKVKCKKNIKKILLSVFANINIERYRDIISYIYWINTYKYILKLHGTK